MIRYTVTFYLDKGSNLLEKWCEHHVTSAEIDANPHFDGIQSYCNMHAVWDSPDGDINPLFYTIEQLIIDY